MAPRSSCHDGTTLPGRDSAGDGHIHPVSCLENSLSAGARADFVPIPRSAEVSSGLAVAQSLKSLLHMQIQRDYSVSLDMHFWSCSLCQPRCEGNMVTGVFNIPCAHPDTLSHLASPLLVSHS